MITGGVMAPAAAAASARRRVKARFLEAGALSPDRAIVSERGPRRMERRYFDDLEAFGAIVRTPGGLHYLDPAKLKEHDSRRRKRALAIVGSLVAATAAAAALLR